jgi:hypothetical protein
MLLCRWLSALGYATNTLVKYEFSGVTYSCAEGTSASTVSLIQQLLPSTALLQTTLFNNTMTNPGPECLIDPSALVEYFGAEWPAWINLLALGVYLLVLHCATFLGLIFLARRERR